VRFCIVLILKIIVAVKEQTTGGEAKIMNINLIKGIAERYSFIDETPLQVLVRAKNHCEVVSFAKIQSLNNGTTTSYVELHMKPAICMLTHGKTVKHTIFANDALFPKFNKLWEDYGYTDADVFVRLEASNDTSSKFQANGKYFQVKDFRIQQTEMKSVPCEGIDIEGTIIKQKFILTEADTEETKEQVLDLFRAGYDAMYRDGIEVMPAYGETEEQCVLRYTKALESTGQYSSVVAVNEETK
jgi:hypothetical protein